MVFDNVINEEPDKLFRGACLGGWHDMTHLSQSIDEDKDGIEASDGFRQVCYHIDRDVGPFAIRDLKRSDTSGGALLGWFHRLTRWAGSDVLMNLLCHFWPVK